MTVRVIQLGKEYSYVGLSTDTKPLTPGVGSTFYETDTRNTYLWDTVTWSLENTFTTEIPALTLLLMAQLSSNEVLEKVLLELTALRLAQQERYNEGLLNQVDFREMAQTILDRSETEEP